MRIFASSFGILGTLSLLLAAGQAAEPTPAGRMMHSFLTEEAKRMDHQFLAGVTNAAQWEAGREERRRQYLEMLGLWPMPERTPLQATVTGTLEREEGFRVEKLHYQSRPGLYVTGNLYLPKSAKAGDKLPAVLYVCGHSGRGRDGNKTAFQHHGMWFATHGYVCLIVDSLQLGEIGAIHHGTYRYDRWWWQARGYTPAGIECWNGIRGLDYLQSRPEVDPERLAVTGISGGGAATFWISAADPRVKVAVPVSGMGDLEDYVGEKIVNGHCDCMFMINTFQWPWMQIAALIAPRPMLFENSGHDTIFPMTGNDRIRSGLEKLYGLYTNRTDRLFDIGVMPGGHDDKVELRLMAYRWINRFLKGDDTPVTEPTIRPFEGKDLRAFPGDLPADEINTKIDELFVRRASDALPRSEEFTAWRAAKIAELDRIVFRGAGEAAASPGEIHLTAGAESSGIVRTEPGIEVPWRHFPAADAASRTVWLVVLDAAESINAKPDWLAKAAGRDAAVVIAPRGSGPLAWDDAHPFPIRRSLPLLGRTLDGCRVIDAVAVARALLAQRGSGVSIKIAGKGQAGVIAAYAQLLEPRLDGVLAVEPPTSHRDGPIFLNVMRVVDIPEAFGLIAPSSLTLYTSKGGEFERTSALHRAGHGKLDLRPWP